jgi:hypothetical protein
MRKLMLMSLFIAIAMVAMEKDIHNIQKEELPIAQQIALLEAYMNATLEIMREGAGEYLAFFKPFSSESIKLEVDDQVIGIQDAKTILLKMANYAFEKLLFANGKASSEIIANEELSINAKLKANMHDKEAQLSKSIVRYCKFYRCLDVPDKERLIVGTQRILWRDAWLMVDGDKIVELLMTKQSFASKLPSLREELELLSKPEAQKPAQNTGYCLLS